MIDDYNMEGDMLSWNLDHVFDEREQKGVEKGIEKGIEKGKIEGKIETAIRMLKLGAELAFVQKATELPLEKIKELQKTNTASDAKH